MNPTLTERQACVLDSRKEIMIVKAEVHGRGAVEVMVYHGAGFDRRLAEARKFAAERVAVAIKEAERRSLREEIDLSDSVIDQVVAAGWTRDEIRAAKREIDHLYPHRGSDDAWKAAALAGPCFCNGRFQCSRCQIRAEMS